MPRRNAHPDDQDYWDEYFEEDLTLPSGYEQCGSCGRYMKPMKENGECPYCWREYHD